MTLTPPVRVEISPDGTRLTVSTTSRTPKTVRLRLHDGSYHPEAGRTLTRAEPWSVRLDLDTPEHRPTVQVLGGGWQDV